MVPGCFSPHELLGLDLIEICVSGDGVCVAHFPPAAIWMSARRILEDQMRCRLISCTQTVATMYFDFKNTSMRMRALFIKQNTATSSIKSLILFCILIFSTINFYLLSFEIYIIISNYELGLTFVKWTPLLDKTSCFYYYHNVIMCSLIRAVNVFF